MAKTRVLITGAHGFVGRHLADALPASDYVVYGTTYPLPPQESEKELFFLDLRSERDVHEAVKSVEPEWVFHLAAVSNVRQSWEKRRETMETNVMGTFFLLEAIRKFAAGARLLFVSSSDVYGGAGARAEKASLGRETAGTGGGAEGAVGAGAAFSETDPVHLVDPYGVSKFSGEILCGFYGGAYGLDIVTVRPFPHTGPGQAPDFVCSDWARQVIRIERGAQEPVLEVGNVEVERDFTDVRDVVRAYILLMRKGGRGEVYNVCSGVAVPLRRILDAFLSLSARTISVRQDPEKMRRADICRLAGDNRKLRQATGWRPKIPLEQTLRDLLDYWRGHP
jgi:GDP-4-dehydro-6-deoxy-D-mannose reductase